MKNIKDMVKDNKKVRFVQYKHNQLWYETECGFRFPIDIADIGDGAFLAEDKAIIFMRYINAYIKAMEKDKPEAFRLDPEYKECSPAYGGCTCACHRIPGMMHCMPCCYPSEGELTGFKCC